MATRPLRRRTQTKLLGAVLLAWVPGWAQTTLSFGGAAEDVVSAGQVRRFLIQLDAPAALHLKVDHGHPHAWAGWILQGDWRPLSSGGG